MLSFDPCRGFVIDKELSKVLVKYQCRYSEVEDILHSLAAHYKSIREQQEYETVEDYFNGNKRVDIGDEVVPPMPDIDNNLLY